MKTLKTLFKQDKTKLTIPTSAQQAIPIKSIWEDGIFLVDNKYSKSYKFEDVNYSILSEEDKDSMFLAYSEALNSFDSGATTKITINNRKIDKSNFESKILIPLKNDNLDLYRNEYNNMLIDKATTSNSVKQEKFITISIHKENIEEARMYFNRASVELISHFAKLGSICRELNQVERLQIFHDFFLSEEESNRKFKAIETMKRGHDFKDFICPVSFEFEKSYFKFGDTFGCALFLKEFASYLKDSFISELCDTNNNLVLSLDIIPVPTDEAVRELENRILGVETNIANWQRKQNQNNNFSAIIPYDFEKQRVETKEFLDDLTARDQRMMFTLLTLVHTAKTKEELDNNTESILTTARKHLCTFAKLNWQQMDGLNTALPFGVRKIDALRTLTTESTAIMIPFKTQDVSHENGNYYGQNIISKNAITINRSELLNGNLMILGVPGGGKSFAAKSEIVNIMLNSDADVIIIDPEREYLPLTKALDGEVINISSSGKNHINALDLNANYTDSDGADPITLKSEFILSICEQIISKKNLGAKEKSIIDRCTSKVYKTYKNNGYKGTLPTLLTFKAELLKQPEPEAKEIALAIELFTDGSLNTFAKQTNVDTENRLICFDILELGNQLLPIGMLVVLDSIFNRISANRAKGRNTYVFIDEIYLLLQSEYSANFLEKLWKRVRKYGAFCTGITQNVEDLLKSVTARTMLSNSEFIIMLKQASSDRDKLAQMLNISKTQLSYITNVEEGHGLIKFNSSLIPFANKFPKDTKLYNLMTTKFNDLNKIKEAESKATKKPRTKKQNV